MLKVSLVSILIVVSTVWWLEERPQLTATRLAVEEALINHGYLPPPEPEHPAYRFPSCDGIYGLIERSDSAGSYPKYEAIQGLIDAPVDYPRYEGVSGCIDRGDMNGGETYALTTPNQNQEAKKQNVTTFSIDVDTASYANIRRLIGVGKAVPPNAVRIEEMINYFRYNYAEPTEGRPLAIETNIGSCPWDEGKNLVHIGLQAKKVSPGKIPPLNLVLLVDVSGSMESADKLPLLRAALREFVGSLRKEDRLSLVTYAGSAGVVLPPTPGDKKIEIENALMKLSGGGGTNGARGILTAYDLARENFDKESINRVILATDGDFNVGLSNTEDLLSLIRGQRDSGIYLTVLGLGSGNINDHLMEQLADMGNGIYAYLDSLAEARRVLMEQAGSSFVPVADDVKVQVEFDPDMVESFRQVGYENRQLDNEDFSNDRKDAGEMGAGHQVTALYEVELAGPLLPLQSIGQVRVRYKPPGEPDSKQNEARLAWRPWEKSDSLRFASSVAEFGMFLKHHPKADIERVCGSLRENPLWQEEPDRKEFQGLVDVISLLEAEKAR